MTTLPQTAAVATTAPDIAAVLGDPTRPVWVLRHDGRIGVTADRTAVPGAQVLAAAGPLTPEMLGDGAFRTAHGLRANYMAGAMANGIAAPALVSALARAGYLGSYGAAGVAPPLVDAALAQLRRDLGELPFACNLIHSPSEPALERAIVDACLRHQVRCVEASAFMNLTTEVVRYRAAGLSVGRDGRIVSAHRVIAKVSRVEVAEAFLRPAPERLLRELVTAGDLTAEQARLAEQVPMADDITAEADSGGHTDRRPLLVLLPELLNTRDRVARAVPGAAAVRIGAAGGIGTPAAAAAAFALGAAYVVTGSVNQACVEAAQCPASKELLAGAQFADCVMAPSADMFEMGVQVQVLRRGTMFAARAQRLYETYRTYGGLDELPAALREDLEQTVFRRGLDAVWQDCVRFFTERDPAQLTGAAENPKRRMALVFRWYLGLSSGWSIRGDADRVTDYQVWCGPAMGAFNTWAAGTHLAALPNRQVAEVADQILLGAAYLTRVAQLRSAGVRLPAGCAEFVPRPREQR
ncbi:MULTISPECIES: PfaD family polyunsaturated fatty acid/polyketide biosynthesis protein [Nocardia]|uniref:PfaD family polyunsaturated fatty acid/polyketide biosynthesis protein n=1 Tax=Nocardia TaxID=1817 RepID=UPI000BF1C28A|nr:MULTISPECIES: PfaD family polyunsaturated fatty acid/polyketide biosynthesis protein [Nocardia]MBF6183928.1 PfaD family polyunsaturated fatty acid/polyketide biosynthesis protein [Nocardia farcinica]MBF6292871.1 PfaD family polyunsaturated fatty acid/polyketide biosynthesis protein [Nocardia farcinica]MBF6309771.1 PfaD family polyunsaturated fatty acid/polyketide biosynthesis protein [Nocardia farcinica]MBF6379166.1 PfaD family polyunsaturated fatty acid/polyketide biosynthesis protein [Noca